MKRNVFCLVSLFLFIQSDNIFSEEKTIEEANKLIFQLEIEKAISVYKEEIKKGSPTASVLYEYGMLQAKLSDIDGAKKTFESFLSKSQASLFQRRFVADFYFYFGDLDKSEKIFDEVLKDYEKEKRDGPSYAWSNYGLGKIALVRGKFDDAEKFFTIASEQRFAPNCSRNATYGLQLTKGLKQTEKWSSVTTNNFIFYFSPQIKELESRESQEKFSLMRQDAFEKICKTLNVKITNIKIRFYVFLNDKEAYEINGVGAHFSETSWWIIFSVFGQSIGHEMTHQTSARIYFGRPDSIFLCEGICVVFDQNPLSTKHSTAKKLLDKGELPTILDLETQPKKYDYYPLSGSFSLFLIDQYGVDKFKQLWILYDFYKNADPYKGSIEKALDALYKKVYQKDLKTIYEEWKKVVNKS